MRIYPLRHHEIDVATGQVIQHPAEEEEDFEFDPPEAPSFEDSIGSTEYDAIVAWVREQTGVDKTRAEGFVDDWAQELATVEEPPELPGGEFDEFRIRLDTIYPTTQELFANADFLNGVQWLPLWQRFPTGAPPLFNLDLGDGTTQAYRTDFLRGAQQVAVAGDEFGIISFPTIQITDLIDIPEPPRGGGRGRADRPFDRNQLIEAGQRMWRSALLDIDSDAVTAGVDDYIRQANGFWKTDGGNLDFETFMLERIRGTERYGVLYEHKPTHMTEGQWIASHTNVVNSFPGLRSGDQRRELETSLTSGASLAGQAQRIGRSERVFRANPQAFTTRLASQVARLGPGGRR